MAEKELLMKTIKRSKKPLVSVVIPVFNGAAYIKEAVQSVQKSTFKRFEVLLIDDGSNDESKLLCKKLEKQYKNVRFYAFDKNKGLGRVLNFALKYAKGKYICRLNQDDHMLAFRMKTQIEYLESHSEVVAIGSYIKYFEPNGKTQVLKFLTHDEDIRKMWHIVSPFSDPSVMYRREVALKVGGYYQSMWPADDTHLWIRMATKGKLANIPKVLVDVRWHESAASLKYFRTLAISTYKMHLWVDENIDKAGVLVHLFWLFQLVSGVLLPPRFNWGVYRVMKKIISKTEGYRNFLAKNTVKMPMLSKVMPHPTKLNISGK